MLLILLPFHLSFGGRHEAYDVRESGFFLAHELEYNIFHAEMYLIIRLCFNLLPPKRTSFIMRNFKNNCSLPLLICNYSNSWTEHCLRSKHFNDEFTRGLIRLSFCLFISKDNTLWCDEQCRENILKALSTYEPHIVNYFQRIEH